MIRKDQEDRLEVKQNFITALKAENLKLQRQIAKLQAENVTLNNRIKILEEEESKPIINIVKYNHGKPPKKE